ncbi:hypothetical protein P3T36_004692 [Kitasatospora sp. MAP12-15]|uniref:hypothetical protein n=1 Tax=unclassified Kitasatospora TaxID=2633591 RepID=UPI002475FB77|nr:hypothetical protein [Kitasatospora sp. MAP12-44]MDH6111538.1 hypothetical protein [Kitasatospora sp. MAP12-44]
MELALGDVVLDRSDLALGMVAGVASQADGNMVVLQLSGGELRPVSQYHLELVGRRPAPTTAARSLATWSVLGVATTAAAVGFSTKAAAGGGWLPALLIGFGSASVVMTSFRFLQRMTAPRRIRV